MRSQTSAWRREIWNANWHTVQTPICNMPRNSTSQHNLSPVVPEPSQSCNGIAHCSNVVPPQCHICRTFLASKFWCDCSMPNESPTWCFEYKNSKRRVKKPVDSITRFLLWFSLEARCCFHTSILLAHQHRKVHTTSVEYEPAQYGTSLLYSQLNWLLDGLFLGPVTLRVSQPDTFATPAFILNKMGCRSLATRRKIYRSFPKATHLPTKYRMESLSPPCTGG